MRLRCAALAWIVVASSSSGCVEAHDLSTPGTGIDVSASDLGPEDAGPDDGGTIELGPIDSGGDNGEASRSCAEVPGGVCRPGGDDGGCPAGRPPVEASCGSESDESARVCCRG